MAETEKRIALLVDGENISADHAGFLVKCANELGRLTICRAYANVTEQSVWAGRPEFKLIHTGKGKNLTDITMIVEAMDVVLGGQADEIVIASSDKDFLPLLRHLKERGVPVHLIGETKASEPLRKAAGRFIEIPVAERKPKPEPPNAAGAVVTDEQLLEFVQKLVLSAEPKGYPIRSIHRPVFQKFTIGIKQLAQKNWRGFLEQHAQHFLCDPPSTNARVRLKLRPPET